MLRKLVPAFGVLAICAAAPAQEIAKGLYLDGWVDTIFTVVDTPNQLPNVILPSGAVQAFPYSTKSVSTDFYAAASLKVGYTVAERVKAKINLWFNNDGTAVNMREAFIAVDLGNNLTWTMGKFINHLGWISAEPTGLFRVNGSTIGYGAFYGANDPLGTGLGWADPSGTFGATAYITNGYYNAKDGGNVTSIDNGSVQAKNDLGLGLDLVANFGADKASNVNLEFAYDDNSGAARTYGNKGYKHQFGLNTTVKPGGKDDALTLGAELLYVTTQYGDTDGKLPFPKQVNLNEGGALLMANYQLPDTGKWPMSVTGMYQRKDPAMGTDSASTFTYFGKDAVDGKPYYSNTRVATNEIAVALLTNPLGDAGFGLNFEVAHAFLDGGARSNTYYPVYADDARHGVTTVSVEAIAVIP